MDASGAGVMWRPTVKRPTRKRAELVDHTVQRRKLSFHGVLDARNLPSRVGYAHDGLEIPASKTPRNDIPMAQLPFTIPLSLLAGRWAAYVGADISPWQMAIAKARNAASPM